MAKASEARRAEVEVLSPEVEGATVVELGAGRGAARIPADDKTLALADGTTARIAGDAIELRDPDGRLLVRHEPGLTTIAASGDLKLAAPNGRVVIEAGTDVAIQAARDLQHTAGRRLELAAGVAEGQAQVRLDGQSTQVETPRLEVRARGARLVTAEAAVVARKIATTAEHLAIEVERYELTAERLVETTRDAFRDVKDLLQERVGRAKVIVSGAYALSTRRTTMVSTEETSVDGKKILLG